MGGPRDCGNLNSEWEFHEKKRRRRYILRIILFMGGGKSAKMLRSLDRSMSFAQKEFSFPMMIWDSISKHSSRNGYCG